MNEQELNELAEIEGPVKSLTPKPLIEMSDEELQAFVASLREQTSQYQTMLAEANVKKKEKAEKRDVNENLFDE